MKLLLLSLCLIAVSVPAFADLDRAVGRTACPLEVTTPDRDFASGQHGFTTDRCDGNPTLPLWQYGVDNHFPDQNF